MWQILRLGVVFWSCVAVGLWSFAPRLLLAGPPLVTDDPETPGAGGWEINLSHNIEETRDAFRMESPLIDINFGRLDNDQWKVEFPILSVDPVDDRGHWGIGDLLLGWKYRFFDEDERGVMASVYPQALIPVGNRRLGLSDGNFELLVPLQAAKHFCDDKLFVYAEVGYNVVFDRDGTNGWIYGAALEWAFSERLALVGEAGGVAFDSGGERDHAFFNAGWKYELNDRWSFIGSVGRSFRELSSGAPELLTYFGLQFTMSGREASHRPCRGGCR